MHQGTPNTKRFMIRIKSIVQKNYKNLYYAEHCIIIKWKWNDTKIPVNLKRKLRQILCKRLMKGMNYFPFNPSVSFQPLPVRCMRRGCRSFWTSLQLNPKLLLSQLSPRQTVIRTATQTPTSTATKKTVSPWGGCWLVGGFIEEKVFKLVAIGPWVLHIIHICNIPWVLQIHIMILMFPHFNLHTEEVPAPEPEPVPVVEKSVRSRGKAPVTVRTSSKRQTKVRLTLPALHQ